MKWAWTGMRDAEIHMAHMIKTSPTALYKRARNNNRMGVRKEPHTLDANVSWQLIDAKRQIKSEIVVLISTQRR